MFAAMGGSAEMVEFLVEQHNANLDAATPKNQTALFFAIRNSHLAIVKYLLGCKANAKLCPPKHRTLRDYARLVHAANQQAKMTPQARWKTLSLSEQVYQALKGVTDIPLSLPPPRALSKRPPPPPPLSRKTVSWKTTALATFREAPEYKDDPEDPVDG